MVERADQELEALCVRLYCDEDVSAGVTENLRLSRKGVNNMSLAVPAKTQIYQALDGLNSEQLAQLWEYIQQLKQSSVAPLYQIHEQAISTGIRDLANQHDHYLYGSDKRNA